MSNAPPLLSVRGLTVRKGNVTLLENVSFVSREGEMTGIFGPSGAGKSTLLHVIAGVPDPSFEISGEITLKGTDILGEGAETRSLRGMAIVLQGLHLFPDMNVLENACYPLRHRGWARAKARAKAMDILQLLHIEELAERSVGRLSGGQQQRVALARAIIYDPCLLLLDEPFKGLEQELREQLLADICMHVRRGIGVLLVTHEKRELRIAADSVIEIREGRLVRAEDRMRDDEHTGFESIADAVLLPCADGRADFVRAQLLGVSANGSNGEASGGGLVLRAQVLEKRRSEPQKSALLLKYESGQAGWIEISSTAAAGVRSGEWITLAYRISSEKENRYV